LFPGLNFCYNALYLVSLGHITFIFALLTKEFALLLLSNAISWSKISGKGYASQLVMNPFFIIKPVSILMFVLPGYPSMALLLKT